MNAPEEFTGTSGAPLQLFRVVCRHPADELPDVVSEPAPRQHAEQIAQAMRETLGHHRGWDVTLEAGTAP